MENLLKGVRNVVVYIDDVVAFGRTQQEHDEAVEGVLRKLADAGLVLKKEKCKWNARSITFLGHEVNEDGVTPLKTKVDAITEMRAPVDGSELKTFLGMVNYYHKFLPNSAAVLEPLHKLLRKDVS